MWASYIRNMGQYEIHITIENESAAFCEGYADVTPGMHFSQITGWDEMGNGTRMFLTWSADTEDEARRSLMLHMNRLLDHDINVVRGKIEECVFDMRLQAVPGLEPFRGFVGHARNDAQEGEMVEVLLSDEYLAHIGIVSSEMDPKLWRQERQGEWTPEDPS